MADGGVMRGAGKLIAKVLLAVLVAGALIGTAIYVLGWRLSKAWNPDPVTVAAASLQAIREQAVLTPFAARFVAVVTSEQHRFGLSARKTLIMPGLARYELDLAAMRQRDLAWNVATRTLTVTLPAIHVSTPQIAPGEIQQYGEGGVLMALTDAEATLDAANMRAGQAELVRQAGNALPMKLARDAARHAIERSFAMPLKAAGLDATVTAKFAGE